MHNIATVFRLASFICLLPLAACNRSATSPSQPQTADRAEHASHADHAEVIANKKAGRTTVYMLDTAQP